VMPALPAVLVPSNTRLLLLVMLDDAIEPLTASVLD